jgi:hypothetical protein
MSDMSQGDMPQDLPTLFGHWQRHHNSLREDIGEIKSSLADLSRVVADLVQLNLQQKDMLMALQVDTQNLVNQVAINQSLEESSALALVGLTAKISDQNTQIAALAAQIAAGQTISPEDIATLQASSASLVQSAKDLTAAVPQGTGTQPVQVTPPAPAPAPGPGPAGGGAAPQGSRRF